MSRVLADLVALEDLASALAASREMLAELQEVTRMDGATAGHVQVADGVADVADDWTVRRARLTRALSTLEAYADAATQAFSDVDATVVTVAVPGRG